MSGASGPVGARTGQDEDGVREDLISNFSHEFRTPLTVMMGWAHRFNNHPDDAVAGFAATVLRQGRNLLKLVDAVLRAQALEAGSLRPRRRAVELGAVLKVVTANHGSMGSRIAVEGGDLGAVFWTDPQLLCEALDAILDNALKFSPPESQVLISALASEGEVRFVVTDRGAGIPVTVRDRVFAALVQGDGSSTRAHGGLGVGLYLVRTVLDALGGQATIQDAPGGGTRVVLSLPQRDDRTITLEDPELPSSLPVI